MENSLSSEKSIKTNDSVIKKDKIDMDDDTGSEISIEDDEPIVQEESESELESENESDIDSNVEQNELTEKQEEQEEQEKQEEQEGDYKGFLQEKVSDYSDDDSSDDEDTYKKLEHSRNLLTENYNNLQSINYIEVEKLSKITRDSDNNIIDDYHKTVPILSKYEKTRILGLRSKQINAGAKPFVTVEDNVIDGFVIAERELKEKKIPFIIKRPISNNKFEYWKLQDLEIV